MKTMNTKNTKNTMNTMNKEGVPRQRTSRGRV